MSGGIRKFPGVVHESGVVRKTRRSEGRFGRGRDERTTTPGGRGSDPYRFLSFSALNPGDIKKREDAFGSVSECLIRGSFRTATARASSIEWAKRCRRNGSVTASVATALKVIVRSAPLPNTPSFPCNRWLNFRERAALEQGACLGIPGITAHRAVHVAGSVKGRTVLIQGGAGAVGACAVQLAHLAWA